MEAARRPEGQPVREVRPVPGLRSPHFFHTTIRVGAAHKRQSALVEVQALVDQSPLANPRRLTLGLEQNRLAMLLAVLHRHGGVGVYDQDVFVNVVGGIRVQETAADLPVLLAVLSSLRDRPLAEKTIAFGEVGLSGEIRPVPNGEDRLREAATHGFRRAIVPRGNAPKSGRVKELEIVAVERISEALEAAAD